MFSHIKKLLSCPKFIIGQLNSIYRENQEIKMMVGKAMANQLKQLKIDRLCDAEFRVFSQWGDDGIIQYLINNIEIKETTFIEFGSDNYNDGNTRFLLVNNNWRGLLIDDSLDNIKRIQQSEIYSEYELTAKAAWITRENINQLIKESAFCGEVGLLSIDLDGNDYWVWKELDVVSPLILILEYNSVFGGERAITVPYDAKFHRTQAHSSNLYFGASLPALYDLSLEKGYCFLGCNSNGSNAYFVRKDKSGMLKELSLAEGYVESRFREARDKEGRLTFVSGSKRAEIIRGMPVYNTRKKEPESL